MLEELQKQSKRQLLMQVVNLGAYFFFLESVISNCAMSLHREYILSPIKYDD